MAIAEGKKFNFDSPDSIKTEYLETFDFDSREQLIVSSTKELSAVCPFSGLPDIAYLKISYYPTGRKCLELKSLKYYITSFRNVGLYQEGVTKRIYDDLRKVLKVKKKDIQVVTKYNVRGGFVTTCIEGEL